MDFDSIDGLFTGTGSVTVANEAVTPGTQSTAPAGPAVTAPAQAPLPGGVNPPARLQFVPASPTPPPDLAGTQPAAPAPAAAPAAPIAQPPATPEGTPNLPSRIATSQFEPEAQRAIDLQHTLNTGLKPGDTGFVPLDKCFEMLKGATAPAQAAAPPQPPGPTAFDLAQTKITEARSNLKALKGKMAELSQFGSDLDELSDLEEQVDAATQAVVDATVQAALAERDTADAQIEAISRQQAIERQAALEVEKRVATEWPSVTDHKSLLGAKVQALATAMNNPSHPDHAVLKTPNSSSFVTNRAAVLVAQEMEAMQGIPFAQALASLRAAPALGSAPVLPTAENDERRILPAAGDLGTAQPGPAPTSAEIMADVGFDPDKIDAVMYGGQKAWRIGG